QLPACGPESWMVLGGACRARGCDRSSCRLDSCRSRSRCLLVVARAPTTARGGTAVRAVELPQRAVALPGERPRAAAARAAVRRAVAAREAAARLRVA